MKLVKILELNSEGIQKVIATCRLVENDIVECTGEEPFVSRLINQGIRDYTKDGSQQQLLPKDGLRFLEQLKYNFKSGYLNATDVLEE